MVTLLVTLLVSVTASADDAEERALKAIKALGGQATGIPIRNVYRLSTLLKDAGLKHLAAFPKLQTLNLGETDVSDAGLKDIVALKGLQTLSLYATAVTDAGLKELAA